VNVTVNYNYYNITETYNTTSQYTLQPYYNYYDQSFSIASIRQISSGEEVVTISNVTPYSNYSSGIGEENIYYLGYASRTSYYQYYPNPYYYTYTFSYGGISYFQSQQLSYMPSEYNYVLSQVISKIESQYPSEIASEKQSHNNATYYALSLQVSFYLSGTQVYWHYADTPGGTSYDDNFIAYSGSSNENIQTNYFGYSNYFPYGRTRECSGD